ncbi:MAG: DNA starvation/stationary phase protection protein [Anaerolineae bacterium]|nr:DNA starvation/stationary phase protection protein [Anaerolineae bacterium]
MHSAVKTSAVAKALGLSDATRQSSVDILTTTLAATYVLYTKTRKFHWNVTGPHFIELHKLFEAQYEELDEAMDAVAERIRMLGSFSIGTLAEMLKHSYLEEDPGNNPDAAGMIAELTADHESVIRHLRADIDAITENGDAGTADFLTGLLEQHEKTAWFLRAHLE